MAPAAAAVPAFSAAPAVGAWRRRAAAASGARATRSAHRRGAVAVAGGGDDGRRRSLGVVVTGSTRGLGLALAARFVAAGDRVLVTSRGADAVASAVAHLRAAHPQHAGRVRGFAADVSVPGDVDALAAAGDALGGVDAWVCNAGVNAPRGPLGDVPADALASVAATNVGGALLVARAAVRAWRAQAPASGGHLFFMEGAGSHGPPTPRMAAYGASKRALPFLARTLRAEREPGLSVHLLSPGMVLTGLLLQGEHTPAVRKVFNILAEEPETVADYLVPRIRQTVLAGRGSTDIRFLTIPAGVARMVAGFAFGYRRNKFFDERTGRRVAPGRYDARGVRVVFDPTEPIEDADEGGGGSAQAAAGEEQAREEEQEEEAEEKSVAG